VRNNDLWQKYACIWKKSGVMDDENGKGSEEDKLVQYWRSEMEVYSRNKKGGTYRNELFVIL